MCTVLIRMAVVKHSDVVQYRQRLDLALGESKYRSPCAQTILSGAIVVVHRGSRRRSDTLSLSYRYHPKNMPTYLVISQ